MKKKFKFSTKAQEVVKDKSEMKVGSYVYADGTYSNKPRRDADLVGIVAWVDPNSINFDKKKGLILTMDEIIAPWKRCVLFAEKNTPKGLIPGQAFFAKKEVWRYVMINKVAINKALENIDEPTLWHGYWTASTSGQSQAWSCNMNADCFVCQSQILSNFIRCLVEF